MVLQVGLDAAANHRTGHGASTTIGHCPHPGTVPTPATLGQLPEGTFVHGPSSDDALLLWPGGVHRTLACAGSSSERLFSDRAEDGGGVNVPFFDHTGRILTTPDGHSDRLSVKLHPSPANASSPVGTILGLLPPVLFFVFDHFSCSIRQSALKMHR